MTVVEELAKKKSLRLRYLPQLILASSAGGAARLEGIIRILIFFWRWPGRLSTPRAFSLISELRQIHSPGRW